MHEHSLSWRSLLNSRKSLYRTHSYAQLKTAAKRAAIEVETDRFKWEQVCTTAIGGNKVFYFRKLEQALVANRIADIIRDAYGISFPNRHLITDQLSTLLRQTAPFNILKYDFRSYFESVPIDKLLSRIDHDLLVPFKARQLLRQLLTETYRAHPYSGLPRGFSVSSVLAELYLTEFDRDSRRLDSVFYYQRFVDDILVFSFDESRITDRAIKSLTSDLQLILNTGKKESIEVGCLNKTDGFSQKRAKCVNSCKCKESDGHTRALDYLGYRYLFSSTPSGNRHRLKHVDITIAPKKVKKVKTRIVDALRAFLRDHDIELLTHRIEFLTSGYPVLHADDNSLYSGNPFNYPALTTLSALRELDNFKAKLFFSTNGSLGSNISSVLTLKQRRALASLSFVSGYKNKRIKNFNPGRVYQIKQCFRQ